MATHHISMTPPRSRCTETSLLTSPTADCTPMIQSMGSATTPITPSRLKTTLSKQSRYTGLAPTRSLEIQEDSKRDGISDFDPDRYGYEICRDRRLGSGRFSSVYLARAVPVGFSTSEVDLLTPPSTPTSPRTRRMFTDVAPEVYAIKTPADKSMVKTLRNEARVLTYLSRHPDYREHIVTFHGYDVRNLSLVFAALPATLEHLITHDLEDLRPASRTTKLCILYPHIARALTSSLAFLHDADVVHADIKPANILLRPDMPPFLSSSQDLLSIPITPVFADFTSSFLITDDAKKVSSLGGGTYDFMAPELLTRPFPAPDPRSDVYALGVTLLNLVLGCSPFSQEEQRMRKIELIKRNELFETVAQIPRAEMRFAAVAEGLLARNHDSLGLRALLELGLRKNPNDRLSAKRWSRLW